jgi:hypothetical protein
VRTQGGDQVWIARRQDIAAHYLSLG